MLVSLRDYYKFELFICIREDVTRLLQMSIF